MTYSMGCCCIPLVGGRPFVPGENGEPCICLDAYQTDVDDTIFTTNANTPQATGKQLVVPAVPAGAYLFQLSYMMEYQPFEWWEVNVTLDGAAPGAFVFPQDHEEQGEPGEDDDTVPHARAVCVDLSAAPHVFEIYLWTQFNDFQTMRETTMRLWRTT